MTKKQDLSEYITTVKKLKPSAEVKFRTKNEEGDIEETIASRTYVSEHMDREIAAADNVPGLKDRLAQVNRRSQEKLAETVVEEDDIEDIEDDVEEEALQENAEVTVRLADEPQDDSPFTHTPNTRGPEAHKTTKELSENQLLIQLVAKLIDKIDEMQNFNPVIHVPAPVIHVTLPETRKTVTKAIERDENNFIKTVRESIEESPQGEPLIEVVDTPKRKPTKKDKE